MRVSRPTWMPVYWFKHFHVSLLTQRDQGLLQFVLQFNFSEPFLFVYEYEMLTADKGHSKNLARAQIVHCCGNFSSQSCPMTLLRRKHSGNAFPVVAQFPSTHPWCPHYGVFLSLGFSFFSPSPSQPPITVNLVSMQGPGQLSPETILGLFLVQAVWKNYFSSLTTPRLS